MAAVERRPQPIPDELIDAARVVGASELSIYWRIVLPQVKPALAVLLFLPTALIFLASQRFFVRGITLTGMK